MNAQPLAQYNSASLAERFAGQLWRIVFRQIPQDHFAMLEKSINSPKASSCGRLIDAVAALLGLSPDRITYEGQAATMLQAQAESVFEQERGFYYPVTTCEFDGVTELQFKPFCTRYWRI